MESRFGQISTRHIEATIVERLKEEPVIVLNGARSVGKSTLLSALAGRLGSDVLDLDLPANRDAVASDPSLYVTSDQTVLIDEFQHVPLILDAIKTELNRDLRPGRFMLTGSTRYDSLPLAAQSLTGRVHLMTIWPLSRGEIIGRREMFLDRLLADPTELINTKQSHTTRDEYIEMVLTGGFPIALKRSGTAARARWFRDYVNLVLQRDVLRVRQIRQHEQLPTFLRHLVAQTAQPLNIAAAGSRAGTSPEVAEGYTRVLEAVFLVYRLNAWGTTLGARVAKHPKVHVVDTGLGGLLPNLTTHHLSAKTPSATTEFGHLLESFVVNEIMKQASWSDHILDFGHYRTHEGVEVDLVIERDDGTVVAIEVKVGSRVDTPQLKGLRSLRDKLGQRFLAGIALHTGQHSYTAEDRLFVMPIDELWR